MVGWYSLGLSMMRLGLEAQQVVALRLMRLAAGGPLAVAETQRMVAEKAGAMAEAGVSLALGAPPAAVIRRARSAVRANRRRLTRRS